MGQGAVAGVGGTRLCDWWFTENAVLIDTAGRYTTQDSNAAVDRAGWDSFLDLLRRTRPRQPLNGVIVAIALSDIADAPPAERAAHAAAIRRRIKELESRLGIRMPVYALFTKADLIAGFTEFFDDLDRERRNQVWGVTFPLVKAEAGPGRAIPGRAAAPGRQPERSPVRSPAGRAKPGAPRPDRRISDPDRHPRAAPAELPRRGLRRLPPRPGAAAARRLFHLGHAGRHADRPPDRGHGARLRPRPAARGGAAAAAGPQLFPRTTRLPGDPGRGHAGERAARPPGRGGIAIRAASYAAVGLADPGRRRAGSSPAGRPASARSPTCRRPSPPTRRSPRRRRSIPSTIPIFPACCRCSMPPATSGRPRAPAAAASWRASTCRRRPSSAPAPMRSIAMPWAMRCCRAWSGGWKRRCAATSPSPTSSTRRRAST